MGMILCPSCGRQTIEGRDTCHYCGVKLPKGLAKWVAGLFENKRGQAPASEDSFLEGAAIRGDFRMKVEEVFEIQGRGTIVTGEIESGAIRTGESVLFTSKRGEQKNCRVKSIEKFRKILNQASAGEKVGLLLLGVAKEEIEEGIFLMKAESE